MNDNNNNNNNNNHDEKIGNIGMLPGTLGDTGKREGGEPSAAPPFILHYITPSPRFS
jgi:hypothetical protein